MSVSEQHSGIVAAHVRAIEGTAQKENTFIFVRPTEYDSTVLIRHGYATKSMDVHHKSSNWGPMAGFVPCDPAFNKKCDGRPNPGEHEHKHGKAHPVQLALRPPVLDALLTDARQRVVAAPGFELVHDPAPARLQQPWRVRRSAGLSGVQAARARFETFQQGGELPPHRFVLPNPTEPGNKSTLFCLVQQRGDWAVFWVEWPAQGDGLLHPLRVFAYPQPGGLVPVTGDYDLWLVAPHVSHLDEHAVVSLQPSPHGASAASGFVTRLLDTLNLDCGRVTNPVFNHGAEAQNYGFTQALDWNLAMFTPGGGSRMVRMNQMPAILADLQRAGYLVVPNKRYGEIDPHLMGAADKRDIGALREVVDRLFTEVDQLRQKADPQAVARQSQEDRSRMPAAMLEELQKTAARFSATRQLGLEQSRILRFHRELLALMSLRSAPLQVLSLSDLGGRARLHGDETLQLQRSLEQQLVQATTGSGESDAMLLQWLQANRHTLERLKTYWRT